VPTFNQLVRDGRSGRRYKTRAGVAVVPGAKAWFVCTRVYTQTRRSELPRCAKLPGAVYQWN